jgi:hypothetical protein
MGAFAGGLVAEPTDGSVTLGAGVLLAEGIAS